MESTFGSTRPLRINLGMSWDILMAVLVFISGISIPIGIAAGAEKIELFTWSLAAFFCLDALINLRRRADPPRQAPSLLFRISDRSSYRWLFTDVIAALALVFIAVWWRRPQLLPANIAVLISLLPLLKLSRTNKISEDLRDNLNLNPSILRLIFFIFWIVLGAHLIALGWILIGGVASELSPQQKYITALYWAVTTLSTVGYGDITPDQNSTIQVVFTMVVMLLGVGMYGYIIGNVATLITNLDAARANYLEKMEEVNLFLKTRSVPAALQERVRSYYRYLWETQRSITTHAIIHELPHTLSTDIALFLNKNILEKVPYFSDADDLFIREIVQVMEPLAFLPGDYIIRQGEYGDSMYFLSSGEIEVIIDGRLVDTHSSGAFFGEGSLITNEKRNASIRSPTYCDVYKLSKQSFNDLRAKYPDFDRHVSEVFAARDQSKGEHS
ncbi:MAG: cyclic nucleotide-binding domain-containing protein [Anaerolineales bacterium]